MEAFREPRLLYDSLHRERRAADASVPVPVVDVEPMRMDVGRRAVTVRMRVLPRRIDVVNVVVVQVAVRVRRLVLNRAVRVHVLVPFREVEP